MNDSEIKRLEVQAREVRKSVIDMIGFLGVGHIGGALSIVEILTLLYDRHMEVTPETHKQADRNRLVISKGHAGPTLYAVLAEKGFFPKEWLHTLNVGGTKLPSHCDRTLTPGIDMSTGSLGQGISAAIGMALANRMDGLDKKIYLIIGDGESQEGQIWEGAMAAAHFKLNNLIAFTDNNKMGIDGYTKDTMNLEDFTAKWSAFGWYVQRVDGHNFSELDNAIQQAKRETARPSMIIMDTIKGKGAFFAEAKLENHNMFYNYDTAKEAIRRLEAEAVTA